MRPEDFIRPVSDASFNKNQLDAFTQRLRQDDEALDFVKVTDPKDLMFSKDGLLQGRYRLNVVGAAQLLPAIASGEYTTIRGLLRDDHPDIKRPNIVPMFCHCMNLYVKHRFPALEGHRLILNTKTNEVDGFVGRSYVLVRNSVVFEQFVQSCELIRGNPKFSSAQLHGRDMVVTFAVSRPLSEKSGAVSLFNGVVIQNRETAGRAIRAANIILDSKSRTWSADGFYSDTRVPHIKGKRFREKMMQMADALATRQPKSSDIMAAFIAAQSRILGNRWDEALQKKIRRSLVARAESLHATATLVDRVFDEMQEKHKAKPTLFDLYTSCLAVASQGRLGNSLPLRQLAYAIVTNGT